jgi:hypothetical protein
LLRFKKTLRGTAIPRSRKFMGSKSFIERNFFWPSTQGSRCKKALAHADFLHADARRARACRNYSTAAFLDDAVIKKIRPIAAVSAGAVDVTGWIFVG